MHGNSARQSRSHIRYARRETSTWRAKGEKEKERVKKRDDTAGRRTNNDSPRGPTSVGDPKRIFAASGRCILSSSRVISSRPRRAALLLPATALPPRNRHLLSPSAPVRAFSRHPSSRPGTLLSLSARLPPRLSVSVRRGAINKTFVTRRLWLTGT